MAFSLRQNCRYSLLVPTSMGLRITPDGGQPVHCSDSFRLQATSAETNVASISSSLGLPVKVLTAFVQDSPFASFIKADLRRRGMDFEGPDIPQGGPWGLRHQINVADSGFGSRGPRVWNDRAGEVGRLLKASDFDLERIFGKEGVQVLHLSGLVAAISHETSEFCLELVKHAKKNGTLVSFDLNYRASFWKGREEELAQAFKTIASQSDILVGNEEDFQLCLGLKGPEAGGKNIASHIESFKGMVACVTKEYPNAKIVATTLREVVDANTHQWGAILYMDKKWQVVEPRTIHVLDRIGGGDGFVGGLLYSVLKGWNASEAVGFAWACGALATTMLTDYALPADEQQVWSIWEGNARVKR